MMEQPIKHSTEWLVGGGEMGELIRATDWSGTPFGPRERWPAAMRAVVNLVVSSHFPMALLWGRELLFLYNDAYRDIAGERHPRALGRSTREIWPEVWHINEPIFAAVLERGEAIYLEDQLFPIDRRGRREEAHFTLCYSPVRAEDGAVAGSLVTLFETTRRVREEQALRAERKRAEEELRHALAAAETGIGAFDFFPQTGHLEWSAHVKRHFGLPPDARVDYGVFLRGLHPEDRERVDAIIQGALRPEGGGEFATEYRTIGLEDGAERWLVVRGCVTFDVDGSPVRFVGITHDITQQKAAVEALQRTRHKLQTTLDSITDGLLMLDRDWCYTEFTETGARMLGLRREDLVGGCVWDLFPHARDSKFFHEYHRAVETKEPVHFEEYYPAPLDRWLECHCYPSDEGLSVYFRDITERKRTEEALRRSEERYSFALRSAQTGAWELDLRDTTAERSLEHDRIFGYDQLLPEWTFELFLQHVLPEDREEVHQRFRHALEHGTEWHFECRILRRDGVLRWILATGRSMVDLGGRPIRMAGIVQDITDRKQAEEALRRSQEELKGANAALIQADQRKNEFLAVLSHELRNPLAPIRNSVYILEHAAPGGEQARRARQVIDRQAQHMARLIDDLLDVTRISKGKITLQPERVDLNVVARGSAEDHCETFARNGIELKIDVDGESLWVEGDRTRLAQVIGNLLSNSAKFTPRGGRTILSTGAAPDGNAVLRVRDNGAGMSEETLQHLFEPFVQASQTLERTRGGLGLGLALVKGLVEMHGGEVTASSEGEGKGSELTVILPLQAPARLRLSEVCDAKRATRVRRVLVIEDNVDAAESLGEVLELDDHEVEIAYAGPEGVEAARRYKPDVVLCDIGLPKLDGYGVARAIRNDSDPAVRSALLVALSGYALPEDIAKSKEAGFDRHIAKPPSIEALEKLLHEPLTESGGGHHGR